MRIFDTHVQELKYQVLKAVIKNAYENCYDDVYLDVPKEISPGPKAQHRCCIYKERAILQERIKLALGGNKDNKNIVEVIDIACDECPIGGMFVTDSCRGCLQHRCREACPRDAIKIIDKKAFIDKEKCIECGKCVNACPYSAIIHQRRPCVTSCKVKAISVDENKKAVINNDKCIACGACVYQCPFGAIQDKSLIMEVIDILKGSKDNTAYKVYAVIAPAIVSQFKYARIEQVVSGIHKLGFYQVVEAALGADITLYKELAEWQEKGLMTTSCCPSFVSYIEKYYPELQKYISHSVSPMVEAAMLIKRTDPTAKVIFIGPCASKKLECKLEKTENAIDSVLSFEELQAFLDARDIDVAGLGDTHLDNASFYGRIFAKSGGVTTGIKDAAAAKGVEGLVPIAMNGIDECKINLLKLKAGKALENFFEGMACDGGCLNGPLCLSHGPKNVQDVDKYGNSAKEKTIDNSVKLYEMSRNNL